MTPRLAPTFLVIGAAKAGTTTLYHVLREHPGVWMSPVKEPHYFAVAERDPAELAFCPGGTVTRWEDYLDLFDGARPDQARGEASVPYLHTEGVIERVRDRLPDVRLVVLLRHPVEATRSRYWMAVRHDGIRESIEELLDREPVDPPSDLPWTMWGEIVVRSSFYAAHLQRWIDAFGRSALLISTDEDLSADPAALLRSVCEHIGADPDVPLASATRLNEGYAPRSPLVHRWIRRPSPRALAFARATIPHPVRSWVRSSALRANDRPMPELLPDTRARLLDLYREDTLALEGILDRDLSAWRR